MTLIRFFGGRGKTLKTKVNIAFLSFAAAALSACARTPPPRPVEVVTKVVEVAVSKPCPDATERARLAALRPAPLRDEPVPATVLERVAKMAAQLLRYESKGGYSDQVDAVLAECAK